MPNTFGPYRLLQRIAAGGMGEVYLAVLEREGGFAKQVALKRILPTLQCRSDFGSMFESEAAVAALLNHANIVQVFDHGCVDNQVFLSMEFVEGPDLGVLLASGQAPFPTAVATEIGVQVCRALSHAHGRKDLAGRPMGIVHGDISPSNILITHEGVVKLADFGLARLRNAAVADGVLTGKYGYMSPEQACAKPLTPQSDLYSLGLVLYELLTGQRAFLWKKSPSEALEAARQGKVPPAASIAPTLPEMLARFLDRTLAREPSDRFRTAAEMAKVLQESCSPAGPETLAEFVRSRAPAAARSSQGPEKTEVAEKPVCPALPSRRGLYAIIASIAIAWAAGFGWWIFHPAPLPKPSPPKDMRPKPPAALTLAAILPAEEPAPLPPGPPKPVKPRSNAPDGGTNPQVVQAPSPVMKLSLDAGFNTRLDHQPVAGSEVALFEAKPALLQLVSKTGPRPSVRLRLNPPASTSRSWRLTIESEPWMTIRLNGRPLGQTPRTGLELPWGRSELQLQREEAGLKLGFDCREAGEDQP